MLKYLIILVICACIPGTTSALEDHDSISSILETQTSNVVTSVVRDEGNDCKVHEVVSGEYCSLIASNARLSMKKFMSFNPDLDCNKLTPGQWVCISPGDLPSKKPKENPDGSCAWRRIEPNDTCFSIGQQLDLAAKEIESFNTNTWRWTGCEGLQIGMKVCVSSGTPPLPDINPEAECGLESKGNKTCPLKLCCSKWGFCGFDEEFCKVSDGAPGTGCQSNCDMDPPKDARKCDSVMATCVGYFESWGAQRPCLAYDVEQIDPNQYTHLHYAFGDINSEFLLELNDEQLDQIEQMKILKDYNPELKLIISVGGWAFNDPGPTQYRFSDMAASDDGMESFITSVVDFLEKYGFDGLDIDWEYPTSTEHGGRPQDYDNYLGMIKKYAKILHDQDYSLSIAAPASQWYLRGYKIKEISETVDYIVYMTYDFHGTWDENIQSLGAHLNPHTNWTDTELAIRIIERAGVKSNKLLLGLGFYGRTFNQIDPNCYRQECKFAGGGRAGECTNTSGFLSYYEISHIIDDIGYRKLIADKPSLTNIMLYGDTEYVGFDTPETIILKRYNGILKCLGGSSIWAIGLDNTNGSLASAASGKRYSPIGGYVDDTYGDYFPPDDFDIVEMKEKELGDISDEDFLKGIDDIMKLTENGTAPEDFWDSVSDKVDSAYDKVGGLLPEKIQHLFIAAGSKMHKMVYDKMVDNNKDKDLNSGNEKSFWDYIRSSYRDSLAGLMRKNRDMFDCGTKDGDYSKECSDGTLGPRNSKVYWHLKDGNEDKWYEMTLKEFGAGADELEFTWTYDSDGKIHSIQNPVSLPMWYHTPGLKPDLPEKIRDSLNDYINDANDLNSSIETSSSQTDPKVLSDLLVILVNTINQGNAAVEQYNQFKDYLEQEKKKKKDEILEIVFDVLGFVTMFIPGVGVGMMAARLASRGVITALKGVSKTIVQVTKGTGEGGVGVAIGTGLKTISKAWSKLPEVAKKPFRSVKTGLGKVTNKLEKENCFEQWELEDVMWDGLDIASSVSDFAVKRDLIEDDSGGIAEDSMVPGSISREVAKEGNTYPRSIWHTPCLFDIDKSDKLKGFNYKDNCKTGPGKKKTWNDGYYINSDDGSISFGSISQAKSDFGSGNDKFRASGNNGAECDHILEANVIQSFMNAKDNKEIKDKFCWEKGKEPKPTDANYKHKLKSAQTSYNVMKALNDEKNMIPISKPINNDKQVFLRGLNPGDDTAYQRSNSVNKYLEKVDSKYRDISKMVQKELTNGFKDYSSEIDVSKFEDSANNRLDEAKKRSAERFDKKDNKHKSVSKPDETFNHKKTRNVPNKRSSSQSGGPVNKCAKKA